MEVVELVHVLAGTARDAARSERRSGVAAPDF